MKNHISFCVNNSKRLTSCFVNELQDVLRFLRSSVFFLYALPFYFYSFLLLPGGGVPRRGEVVGELIFLFLPVSPFFPCFFLFLVPAYPYFPSFPPPSARTCYAHVYI